MRPLHALSLALLALPSASFATTPDAVTATYADIAQAAFTDSLTTAQSLQSAVTALIAAPSPETLHAARAAWALSRIPYAQTEVFRFGNPAVDDWEGRVNAWPLDEGLIDYTATFPDAANPLGTLDIIATPRFTLSGQTIDATAITPALIRSLHEAGGTEANVASGYHAIEFLLWGQDLNGTNAGAGDRPFTDFLQTAACTHGHCDRRAAYLSAATALLVSDLQDMAGQWSATGPARARLVANPQAALSAMLTGMGSLGYGELAGERMKLGLLLNDPEEEQDCFSDTTPTSHLYDGIGIRNVYLGRYTRTDGSTVSGPALTDLVAARDPALDRQIRADLDASVTALTALQTAAQNGMAYDQMLASGNVAGAALVTTAIDALVTQTDSIGAAVTALGLPSITFEGSASLDTPAAVFQ